MKNNKSTQYSLRKLSIGLASVTIGIGVVGSMHHGDVAKAEVVGKSSNNSGNLDTRKPKVDFVDLSNQGINIFASGARKFIVKDENGNVLPTDDREPNYFRFNKKISVDTPITVIPVDVRGVQGDPEIFYYTDRSKASEIYQKYGEGYSSSSIYTTPLYKNASEQAQAAYKNAVKEYKEKTDTNKVKQAEIDRVATNLKIAYENLYKDRAADTDNNTGSTDNTHTGNVDQTPTIPSNKPGQSTNIPSTDNKPKINVSETSFLTIVYAPVINNNPNYMIALRDKDGKLTGKYISTNSRWKVFAKKIINGEIFYRLGTQNQWVPAKYLSNIDKENNVETSVRAIGYVAILHNNRNYKVALYSSTGKLTGYLRTNSNWKVFAKKTINGVLMYRLGNQNQWIPAKYIKLR